MSTNFTLGADPELFLFDKIAKQYISGEDLIPGTKQVPFAVDKGAIQVDGVAWEFNINPVSSTEEFKTNVLAVMGELKVRAKKISPNLELHSKPSVDFDPYYFQTLSPYSRQLGCEPDYNAYSGTVNSMPNADVSFRTGSGHIHIGWGSGLDEYSVAHFGDCTKVVKQLDYYLGVQEVLWSNDTRRRDLYGDYGAFRPKSYGVEYRVLSNAWLGNPGLIEFVSEQTLFALSKIENSCKVLGPSDKLALRNKKILKTWLKDRNIPMVPKEFHV